MHATLLSTGGRGHSQSLVKGLYIGYMFSDVRKVGLNINCIVIRSSICFGLGRVAAAMSRVYHSPYVYGMSKAIGLLFLSGSERETC